VSRFILFLFIATPAMLESGKAPDEVNLCTLVSDWQRFSGEMVRVKAVFREGAEQNALFDPGCRDGVLLVYVSPLPQVAGKKRRLRRILGKDGPSASCLGRRFPRAGTRAGGSKVVGIYEGEAEGFANALRAPWLLRHDD